MIFIFIQYKVRTPFIIYIMLCILFSVDNGYRIDAGQCNTYIVKYILQYRRKGNYGKKMVFF